MKTNKGIGIFAVVIIIAIIIAGGYGVTQISKQNKARLALEEQSRVQVEVQQDAKKAAQTALVDLKTKLKTSTDTAAELAAITKIKEDLTAAYANAEVDAKADLAVLTAQIDAIAVALQQSGPAGASLVLNEVIGAIEASIEATSETMMEDDVVIGDDETTEDTEEDSAEMEQSTMEDPSTEEMIIEETEVSAEVSAEVEAL